MFREMDGSIAGHVRKATLGRPLAWWGASRPDGNETDRWMTVRFAVSYRIDQGCKVD